jgi:hypothetical protein
VDIVRAGSNPAVCSVGYHFATLPLQGGGYTRERVLADAPVCSSIVGVAGVMVSIVAFQAVDPGSIPGPRSLFYDEECTGSSTVWRACLA